MDRGLVCANKLCAKRVEQRRLELHRDRVRNVRPLVDTSKPVATHMDHVRNNMKKEQMLEERYGEIDRENRILLNKMSEITKQPACLPTPRRPPGPQSLNRETRKKELLRITRDNHSILRRIQQAQPVYNHVEWELSHRRHRAYVRNCTEFPAAPRSARGRPSELVPVAGSSAGREQRPQSARLSRTPAAAEVGAGAGGSSPPRPAGLRCVLKEGRLIGGTYFLVEMATDGWTLSIAAYDGETRTSLELVVEEAAFRGLYREAHGDYSVIAQQLAVEDNKLVLARSSDEMDAEAMVAARRTPGFAG
mmetsp:Transcript_85254/g.266774  ORF Transcript_85254/g.266774 Transcript_85254/m.266774 type:complete len:306 (+) Transcript_85254:35-952(+)